MLNICMEFGVDYDVKFNDMKSVAMRVDPLHPRTVQCSQCHSSGVWCSGDWMRFSSFVAAI